MKSAQCEGNQQSKGHHEKCNKKTWKTATGEAMQEEKGGTWKNPSKKNDVP